jgi:hypothetical protein
MYLTHFLWAQACIQSRPSVHLELCDRQQRADLRHHSLFAPLVRKLEGRFFSSRPAEKALNSTATRVKIGSPTSARSAPETYDARGDILVLFPSEGGES